MPEPAGQRITDARQACAILAAVRKDQALTHRELAEVMGSSAPSMSQLESGHHSPTLKVFLAWVEALGYEVRIGPRGESPSYSAIIDRTLQRLRSGEAQRLRKVHRMSLESLAEQTGVRPSAVRRWELGQAVPRTRILINYGKLLDQLSVEEPATLAIARCVYGDDGLGIRTRNTLKRAGIELEAASAMTDSELLEIEGFGHGSLARVRQAAATLPAAGSGARRAER